MLAWLRVVAGEWGGLGLDAHVEGRTDRMTYGVENGSEGKKGITGESWVGKLQSEFAGRKKW